jgi:hypothetical protein
MRTVLLTNELRPHLGPDPLTEMRLSAVNAHKRWRAIVELSHKAAVM